MPHSDFLSRRRPGRRCRGFTLVETLVALTIFAFVLSGLTRLLLTTIQSNEEARRLNRAGALAQAELETLQALPFASVASGSDSAADGLYTRRWTVTADTPVSGAKTVQVAVAWTDKEGAHAVGLPSVISQQAAP